MRGRAPIGHRPSTTSRITSITSPFSEKGWLMLMLIILQIVCSSMLVFIIYFQLPSFVDLHC